MTDINATLVKTLRDRTGAGVIDCKKALVQTHGDLEAAVDLLRAAEIANAASKVNRVAAEGLVGLVVEGTKGADRRTEYGNRFRRAHPGIPERGGGIRRHRAQRAGRPRPLAEGSSPGRRRVVSPMRSRA